MDWLQILGAIGIGSVITVLAQWGLTRFDAKRSLRFNERKEAYIGLWLAMHRSEVEKTEEAALHVGHWVARCNLVAPDIVVAAVDRLITTKPGTQERSEQVKLVITTMRADLGIS